MIDSGFKGATMNKERDASWLMPGLLLALIVGPASCQSGDEPRVSLADPAAIDRMIDDYVDVGAYPFVYVRLEDKDGSVIYEHGAANAELLPVSSVDGQTWLRIWSMSKIVTISIVLDLVEEGVLSLDDPVVDYIPEFTDLQVAVSAGGEDLSLLRDKSAACPIRLVTVESEMKVIDLINHKAGFYYATTGMPCIDGPLADSNLPMADNSQDLIDRLATLPLIQQPGTNDHYGTNTTVLGLVAERATGKSLKQRVEQRVTGPLGINGLQYGLPSGVTLLPRISGRDGVLREAYPGELDIFGPDVPDYDPGHALYLGGEGMLGTTDGYADFLRMLLNRGTLNDHRFLDEASIKDMTSPQTQLDSAFGYNGYNLWVTSGKMNINAVGQPGLWVGGGYEGTHFWIDPKREFVGVIVTQIYWVPESGQMRDETLRSAIYRQIDAAAR